MAKKGMSTAKVVAGVGAGLATIAAGVAGAYFLYGKQGAKNRKKVKAWVLKAKAEMMEKIEKMKDVNEELYHKAVDAVAAKYQAVKNIDPAELSEVVKELRGHWSNIKKEIMPKAKKPVAKKKK